nr:hypothetical protein [Tanacetum cinerariifolium]
ERGGALLLGTVALAELLHLVTTLSGGFRWRDVRTSSGHLFSHRIPVRVP